VSRLSFLASHPRRALSALAVVVAAGGVTVGSGANFTAQTANTGNLFATGSLTLGNSASEAVFNVSNMKPGDQMPGSIDIENTGTVEGQVAMSAGNLTGSTVLAGVLTLKIVDCGKFVGETAPTCGDADDVSVHDGTVAALAAATEAFDLGAWAPGEKHRLDMLATLPGTAGDDVQNSTLSLDFTWNATSL
jgi:spore coat-associated protein N